MNRRPSSAQQEHLGAIEIALQLQQPLLEIVREGAARNRVGGVAEAHGGMALRLRPEHAGGRGRYARRIMI